jgi:hypothetical protein
MDSPPRWIYVESLFFSHLVLHDVLNLRDSGGTYGNLAPHGGSCLSCLVTRRRVNYILAEPRGDCQLASGACEVSVCPAADPPARARRRPARGWERAERIKHDSVTKAQGAACGSQPWSAVDVRAVAATPSCLCHTASFPPPLYKASRDCERSGPRYGGWTLHGRWESMTSNLPKEKLSSHTPASDQKGTVSHPPVGPKAFRRMISS